MLGGIRRRLTFANVVSVIALFCALGGGAYAAVSLPKNSVGSKQLKKNAVTNAKIGKNAVTGAKVKDASLTGSDINLSTLPKVGSAGSADNAAHATNADSATKATSADNATNAGHATNADSATNAGQLGGVAAARYVTNDSALASGQTETGYFAGSGNAASGYVVTPINFIPKAPAAVPFSNVHLIAYPASSGPNCAGAGQAAAGHVCIYEGWRNALTFDCFGGAAACGNASTDRNGFAIYYNPTAGTANVTGTWAYTAP